MSNLQEKHFGGINWHVQVKLAKYFRNYYIDSNQILHSDKDHLMPFVGGPNTCITSLRCRIFKKMENRPISATIGPITMKSGTGTHIDPLKRVDRSNFENFKIQDGGRPPF